MFILYSWITNIGWILLDFMPPFVRNLCFSVLMDRFGKGSNIDYKTYIRYLSKISIGSGTMINRGCRLIASHHYPEVRIVIGNHVAMAPEVCILAAGHDYRMYSLPNTAASVHIGDYCWLGARSTILQGVTVGEGAVVAAGSVVTRDVEPYTIVAGNPARVIKHRIIQEE